MASPTGYNNPAYNHQFDSSLYEYQYVPEIDPDLEKESTREHEQIHLVHPNFQQEFSEATEVFDASDESNQSIIVEECNNRRITLICEKRNRTYEDSDCRGAYHHDISLESEKDYEISKRAGNQGQQERLRTAVSAHEEDLNGFFRDREYEMRNGRNKAFQQTNGSVHHWINRIPQRQHRYEEIVQCQDADMNKNKQQQVSRHRYAEITVDENGYPSIGNEIEIEHNESGYKIVNSENQREFPVKAVQKPRAASPVNLSFSPNFSPSKTYQRTLSPNPPNADINLMRMLPNNPTSIPNRSIPHNSIEMLELSPPQHTPHTKSNQRFSYESPKRHFQSDVSDLQNQMKIPTKNVKLEKINHRRYKSISESNFEEQPTGRNVTPKTRVPVAQIFHAKTTPRANIPKGRPINPESEKKCVRRNISNSFVNHPEFDSIPKWSNPYKPTTAEVGKAKTAIITPILQRKTRKNEVKSGEDVIKFQKLSHIFQSTGNLYKDMPDADGLDPQTLKSLGEGSHTAKIKRNQSVPNFAQTFANEGRFKQYVGSEQHFRGPQKPGYQCSPTKSMDRFSSITRSRISLIDQTKMSWSNSGTDFHSSASGCLIVGAVVQIVTSIASCAICFYLFSKLGRRYYLDFGILAGFVNLVLGVLGFRSQCWRWLPNRNYVSGYILLTAFSMLTCCGFVYLITARPMSGDPILDLMGGGICGISVLTIILSVTGLTMSGCCKTPPPDNRVNNI